MPKRINLPTHIVLANPAVCSAIPSVANAIIGAITRWWDTQCYHNPDWHSLTRLRADIWHNNKQDIIAACEQLKLDLLKYRAQRMKAYKNKVLHTATKMAPALARKRAENRLAKEDRNITFIDEHLTHTPVEAVSLSKKIPEYMLKQTKKPQNDGWIREK